MSHIAIAIDGPAASGKSTLAKGLAKELNLVMVDSGAMYRAVALACQNSEIDLEDEAAVLKAFQESNITFGVHENRSSVELDGKILTQELRTEAINSKVSAVAKLSKVREFLVAKQRAYLKESNVVMEGRDIGTVVFSDTPFKLFLQASTEIRQSRRNAEGIQDSIAQRDAADSTRKASPLKPAKDAIILQVDNLDVDGVRAEAIKILTQQGLSL